MLPGKVFPTIYSVLILKKGLQEMLILVNAQL
jgi:hypothetical protein